MKLIKIKATPVRGHADGGREREPHGTAMIQTRPARHFVTFALELGGEITVGVSGTVYDLIFDPDNRGEPYELVIRSAG